MELNPAEMSVAVHAMEAAKFMGANRFTRGGVQCSPSLRRSVDEYDVYDV